VKWPLCVRQVTTVWTMHFWIGRDAHELSAGVAAVLAVDLCKALKRHARPIREVDGAESAGFRCSPTPVATRQLPVKRPV